MNTTSARPYAEAVLELLPYAIPVLRDRLGPLSPDSKNPTEPSEELRVKLHALLRWLLSSAEAVGPGRYCSPRHPKHCESSFF